MTENGSELRHAMRRHLDGLEPVTPIEQIRQKARRGRLLVATSLVTVIGLVGASGVFALTRPTDKSPDRIAAPGIEPEQGQITFTRFTEDGGIMTMNADGSDIRNVSAGNGYAVNDPAWSPDGTKIAFHGFSGEAETEAGGLFVINADGSDLKLLELGGGQPTWSPDGSEIAFEFQGTIRIIGADGENSRQLVERNEGSGNDELPDWSPDGQSITYTNSQGLFLVAATGGKPEQVGNPVSTEIQTDAQWSPDGTEIAVAVYTRNDVEEIPQSYISIVDVESGDTRRLIDGRSPTWSPDGTRIAFSRADGTNESHIYSVAVDGTDEQQLTAGTVADHSPDWGRTNTAERTIDTHDRCGAPPVQPTYLPWLDPGDGVPPPTENYDAEIDRHQQSWTDPQSPEARVALTLGPSRDGVGGEAMNLFIQNSAAHLHEARDGSRSISWTLDGQCRFLELTFTDPNLTKVEIEEELIRTARSLEEPVSREGDTYMPPEFLPLSGWYASSEPGGEGGSPNGWTSTFDFGDRWNYNELANLGSADIALHAQLVTPSDYMNYPLSSFPDRELPLRFKDAKTHKSFSAQWDEDIPAHLLNAHVDGHRLMVWIYFGTPSPSQEMLQQADRQLQKLRLPPGWET